MGHIGVVLREPREALIAVRAPRSREEGARSRSTVFRSLVMLIVASLAVNLTNTSHQELSRSVRLTQVSRTASALIIASRYT